MAYRVRWSPRAADDLEAIAEYISLDSPAYAKAVVKTIVEITRKFSQFPRAGRTVPELNDENIVNGSLTAIESFIGLTKTSLQSLR